MLLQPASQPASQPCTVYHESTVIQKTEAEDAPLLPQPIKMATVPCGRRCDPRNELKVRRGAADVAQNLESSAPALTMRRAAICFGFPFGQAVQLLGAWDGLPSPKRRLKIEAQVARGRGGTAVAAVCSRRLGGIFAITPRREQSTSTSTSTSTLGLQTRVLTRGQFRYVPRDLQL